MFRAAGSWKRDKTGAAWKERGAKIPAFYGEEVLIEGLINLLDSQYLLPLGHQCPLLVLYGSKKLHNCNYLSVVLWKNATLVYYVKMKAKRNYFVWIWILKISVERKERRKCFNSIITAFLWSCSWTFMTVVQPNYWGIVRVLWKDQGEMLPIFFSKHKFLRKWVQGREESNGVGF